MKVKLTEAEYRLLCDETRGVCLSCGDTTTAPVEPDAENYKCEKCEMPSVMGAEFAMVAGHITFGDD